MGLRHRIRDRDWEETLEWDGSSRSRTHLLPLSLTALVPCRSDRGERGFFLVIPRERDRER